jgi:hypothetical protein
MIAALLFIHQWLQGALKHEIWSEENFFSRSCALDMYSIILYISLLHKNFMEKWPRKF